MGTRAVARTTLRWFYGSTDQSLSDSPILVMRPDADLTFRYTVWSWAEEWNQWVEPKGYTWHHVPYDWMWTSLRD